MSFRCEKCKSVGQRPKRIVVERKMVDHLQKEIVRHGPRGGHGQQIIRELVLCEECAAVTPEAPIERAEPVQAVAMPEVADEAA